MSKAIGYFKPTTNEYSFEPFFVVSKNSSGFGESSGFIGTTIEGMEYHVYNKFWEFVSYESPKSTTINKRAAAFQEISKTIVSVAPAVSAADAIEITTALLDAGFVKANENDQ